MTAIVGVARMSGMNFADAVFERLPSGRHQLARDVVTNSQRLRLMLAVVAAVGERGWAGTRIADVVEHAGVSRATFYQQFSSLEACLVDAFEFGIVEMLKPMDEAAAAARDHDVASRLDSFFASYVQTLQAVEGLPRTLHVELLRAPDRLLDTRRELFDTMARRMERSYMASRRHTPSLAVKPPEVFDALVAGLDELYRERIRALGPQRGLDGLADLSAALSLTVLGVDRH